MPEIKKRESVEQVAHKKALKMALAIFMAVICLEISIILGERVKTEVILFITAIAIPLVCAIIIYFRFRNLHKEEETYRRQVDLVQKKIDKEEFVQVEAASETGLTSTLSDRVDMVAVKSNEDDTVIVAISHNDDIIPVQELPKQDFIEHFNVIEDEDKET